MPLFKKVTVKDSKGVVLTVGDKNLVSVSQHLSEIKETSITSEGKNWEDIISQISSLQQVMQEIPDQHEELREQQLRPQLSKAKAEAKKIAQNPAVEKKPFVDTFKAFCDVANSVTEIGVKVAPFAATIAKLMGIPLPF
jgi:hypothetical protein